MQGRNRRAWNAALWIALVVIVLFAAGPLLSVIASSTIAELAGCTLHEGNRNPCLVLGMDLGGQLYRMFVAGWYSFITLPIGGLALLVWIGLAIWTWTRPKPAQPPSG